VRWRRPVCFGEAPMNEPEGNTIVAIATPLGAGGVAIVRVSGPEAQAVAGAVFRPHGGGTELVSHHARLGVVVWPAGAARARTERRTGEPLDEALLLPLLGRRSYTGEDTVEFQCHGGRLPAQRVLEACVAAGARPAEAGEFTRRAFANGRLSLDQAEAVADLIHAEDELAASAALAQLRGGLRREIEELEAPLLALLAELEASMEFADEEAAPAGVEQRAAAAGVVREAVGRSERLLALAPAARQVREGVRVVLTGPPNVGKSSLFNALLGEERALVDADPGTTRDIVTGTVRLGGFLFVLHDTAGLRGGAGRLEELGMARARATAAGADIVLRLRDLSSPSPSEPLEATGQAGESPGRQGAIVLDVGTKADLAARDDGGGGRRPDLATSTVTNEGMEAVSEALIAAADTARMNEVAALGLFMNERHRARLMDANEGLKDILALMAVPAWPEEVVATALAGILVNMGEISGRVFSEKLLGEIFSRFCVGK